MKKLILDYSKWELFNEQGEEFPAPILVEGVSKESKIARFKAFAKKEGYEIEVINKPPTSDEVED